MIEEIKPLKWIVEDIKLGNNQLKLFDGVGFFYEMKLARVELLTWHNQLNEFLKRAAYFEEIKDNKTYYYFIPAIRGKG